MSAVTFTLHTHVILRRRGLDKSGIIIKFKTVRKGHSQLAPFKVDESTVVEFPSAVLASAVGTEVQHNVAVTEAVVVRIYSLLLGKDPAVARLFPFSGLVAAYTVLASLLHYQRVPAPVPGSNAVQRFAIVVTRKGVRKGSVGRRALACLNLSQEDALTAAAHVSLNGGKSIEQGRRGQPPEAGCCTRTRPTVCEASPCGGNFSSTRASPAAPPRRAADSTAGTPAARASMLAKTHAVAAVAVTAAPATPSSAGRFSATFELKFIRLWQQIDPQRSI
eukprot:3273099-Pleurochrysis_carterae.AAC.2